MSKKFGFIDLFSGCGGFSAGLELAGHKCLLGVDFDADAIESFANNHPNAKAVCTDIHKLTSKKLSSLVDFAKVDMVVGGPPCQGFSTVGKGDSSDERNSLFKQFLRVVRITEPKIVLFENVTGILASKNKPVLDQIFKSFEKLGYTMDAQVLSADEYGVPSRRKRTIIMGVKGGAPLYPKAKAPRYRVNVAEALADLSVRSGEVYNHDVNSAQISKDIDKKRLKYIPAGAGIRYEKDELEYLPKKLRFDVDWEELSERRFRQTRLQRLPLDQVAPTILTSRSMYYHPTEIRYLTPREAARLQSFPNKFVFSGSVTSQFRQIGNAVPPLMAKEIGKELKKIKFNLSSLKERKRVDTSEIRKNAFNYKEARYA